MKCEMCDNQAVFAFIGTKNGQEETFYGCKEHFLDMISTKVNEQGYQFVQTFPIKEEIVPQAVPQAIPQAIPQAVVPPKVVPQVMDAEKTTVKNDDVVGTDAASGRDISGTGKLRAMVDEAEAVASGFTLAKPLYSIGTKVIDVGVQNFRRSREEFEAKPKVIEACDAFLARIEQEKRRDSIVRMNEICMLPNGRLTKIQDDRVKNGSVVLASAKTLGQLMAKSALESTGVGYLESCPTLLRAHNVNHWMSVTDPGREIKLRMRKIVNEGIVTDDSEVYAVVSPSYATFDADKIASIVKSVCPEDARAEVLYDGYRTRINVTFHSDIKPEDCVTGELFKAGIIVKTSDTGDGSIQVSAFVERNLCLNLIVIDQAVQNVVRRRHKGDQDIIAEIVENGIQSAYGKIEGFVKKWGFANKEDLLTNTIDLEIKNDAMSPKHSLTSELFMAGLFNGMIERELVTVKGKRDDAIDNLVSAWNKEPMLTRAGAINAVTRYAHEVEQNSPWDEDVLQEEAGKLLFSNQPLPWLMVKQD